MKSLSRPLGRMAQWQSRTGVAQQANAAQHRGDWAEAARLYEIEIAQSPQRADLLIQLGHCNKERGEYRRSYENYLAAINIQPFDDDVYLHVGHLLKVTGNLYCASRCYLFSSLRGNIDATSEYNDIGKITIPPRFSFREKRSAEGTSANEYANGDERRLNLILGTLEMCEVDTSAIGRLREAAQLLFLAGCTAAAKGMFEMSFIREGFGLVGRRNSIEIGLRTGLWGGGGPFLHRSRDISGPRAPFPTVRRAAVAWLIAQFNEDGVGASMPASDEVSDPLRSPAERISSEFAELYSVDALAAHSIFMRQQATAIRDLVSCFYEALSAGSPDDDWTQLRAVMCDLKASVADAAPLISFDTDDIRDNVEVHAARILFNNLYDFIYDNYPSIIGPSASPQVLARTSRFECPMLAPYLGKASALHDSPSELINDLAYEIARSDLADRRALEHVIALIGSRIEGDALHHLFSAVLKGGLPNAIAALLHSLMSKHRNNRSLIIRFSQILKHAGFFEMARVILQTIPGRKSVEAGSVEFDVLIERAILEKICGNFDEAVRIFASCLSCDQGNQFVREEILTLLPETDDMEKVLDCVKIDPEFIALAQRRRLYRLHLDGWTSHGVQSGEGPKIGNGDPMLELMPGMFQVSTTTYLPERSECVDIVHLGWERRTSQWGDLPVLRGIEAIRVRVISMTPLLAMRVRFDGRTVCLEQARPIIQSEQENEYIFNAWFDSSALRAGLHELQLYLEELSGGYRIREELVFVDRPLGRDDAVRNSGSIVVLDASTPGLPLEERVKSLPSVVYSTRRYFCETPIRRVLVVRADQLGDFVVSIPAIHRLRDLLPDARFFGLVSPSAMELAQTSGFFEELFEVNMIYAPMEGRRYLSLHDQIELRRQLGKHSFDLAIDLSTGSDTRPVLRLSGAPITVGFKPHEFPWLSFGIDAVTRDAVNGRERVPHGTVITMLVDALGTLLRSQDTVKPPLPPNKGRLERFGIDEGEHYLLLHTGSRLLMKQWPLTHYRELARLAIGATEMKIVMLVDTPSEAQEIETAGLPTDRFCVVAGRLPFAELDALVSHCAAMVGNDSGPKHLAASRGAKVVSVHMGQVNWQEWGQEGDGLIVTRHVPCYGCGIVEAHECGKDLACLVHIRPEEVLTAVQQVLASGVGQNVVSPELVPSAAHIDRPIA
jgi:ADP-heptose:LPS heptosyltransferase